MYDIKENTKFYKQFVILDWDEVSAVFFFFRLNH